MSASTVSSLTRAQLKNQSTFQRSVSRVSSEKEPLRVMGWNQQVKTSAYNIIQRSMVTAINEHAATYTTPAGFDVIAGSYIRSAPPRVAVAEPYRSDTQICWSRNWLHNILVTANCQMGGIFQTLDSHKLDQYIGWYRTEGEKVHDNRDMGNIPALLDWNDTLPGNAPCFAHQWWFYGRELFDSFPLFLFATPLTHEYQYNLSIWSLLRMRIRDPLTGKWVCVSAADNEARLELGPREFPMPQMVGLFQNLDEPAKEFIRNFGHEAPYVPDKHVVYYQALEGQVPPTAPVSMDEKHNRTSINLRCDTGGLALFWNLENNTARDLGSRSNYSTDPDDATAGYGPMLKYVLGERDSGDNLSASEIAARYHFPGRPSTAGYYVIPFDWEPTRCQVGNPELTNSALRVVVGNNDIYRGDRPPIAGCWFNLLANILALKEYTIVKSGQNYTIEFREEKREH
jgi:hypothetical protein